jgi:uncharacterized protein involved in outer membrane biogenesis
VYDCRVKWVFKIFRWLVFLIVVAIIIAILALNTVLKAVTEKRIRDATGMDAEIGKLSFGLLTPTVTLGDFKLYSPPDFGGTPFLNISELHAEYDLKALRKHELHLTLLRLNLEEIDVVKNQAGRTNVFSILGLVRAKQPGASANTNSVTWLTGFKFTGVDLMNISIGKARLIDLKDQNLNRWVDISLENQIIKNVKSPADLAGLGALIWLRGGHTVGLPVSPPGHNISTNSP